MTFLGIENTNEFFTQHYLTAILQGDLRPVLDRWRAAAKVEAPQGEAATATRRAPPQALAASQVGFFRYLDRLESERTPEARVTAHFDIMSTLLADLGYGDVVRHTLAELPSGDVPLYGQIQRADGAPILWMLPVLAVRGESHGTLATEVAPEQLDAARRATGAVTELRATGARTAEELIHEAFNLDEPPRFVLALGTDDIVLAERAKWAEQRLLRFDLREILGRRQNDTLDVTAALLHRDSLVPADGIPLLDDLDDNSHKHAFEVSEDLKYALQASIERLGNAAVDYLRHVKKQKVFGTDGENEVLAEQISRECLRYMYRLLFLFYIEARPELGYSPNGEVYQLGYSLERLRELEQLDLSTEEARRGSYIHQSLRLLFDMIYNGRAPEAQSSVAQAPGEELAASHFSVFELAPLRSHLFDPERTPILDGRSYNGDRGVVFSNEVLRDVIENMSLTWPDERRRSGRARRNRRRGRISYATLGINQLGAVYEALLSFRGFLAKSDLFEVKPADDADHDVLDTAYFVTEDELGKYKESERIYEGNALKRYPKGTFIYRLAGRDRQTSASYYTPEVLTRTTVKYALKELLEDEAGNSKLAPDEILRLTVCEPAMGSAAFLNEAINQLAEAYLSAKQQELGTRIPHDEYAFEKQRVKMFIADNNVFGVDLNPIAVELAGVALWLNTIHAGGFVPWFTGQTVCGNSLVGARRQVFPMSSLLPAAGTQNAEWLNGEPVRARLGSKRPEGSVYHFLLGDRAMSVYARGQEGKPIRELAKDSLERIDAWRTEFCKPLDDGEVRTLQALSGSVDRLWDKHAELLKRIRLRTTDPIQIYGQRPPDSDRKPTTTAYKDKVWADEMLSETVRASSPYRRLRLVMDYWCSLWFWPIEQAMLLPSRDEFLEEIARILDTTVSEAPPAPGVTLDLFPVTALEDAKQLAMEYGLVNLHSLIARSTRLQLVQTLSARHRYLHWELEFADVLADRGGFDLIVGNPPWIRVEWKESDFLGDLEPVFAFRPLSAKDAGDLRDQVVVQRGAQPQYLAAYEDAAGLQDFLGARQNFPILEGMKVNLYKGFLADAIHRVRDTGTMGFVTDKGVFTDPAGGRMRQELYPRLRYHFQFRNQLRLFHLGEGDNNKEFEIGIYGSRRTPVRFASISNLLHPQTIDACFAAGKAGPVPGIKDESGNWVLAGHPDRVVTVSDAELKLFATLYDEPGTPTRQARLPAMHARPLLLVAQRFADQAKRLGDLNDRIYANSTWWNEHTAKEDGTIKRETRFVEEPLDWIVSGPHFYVANPFSKTPRRVCTTQNAYDVLDLVDLPDEYWPRTNYVPAQAKTEYVRRAQSLPWDANRPAIDVYRVVASRGLSLWGERTLQASIAPPGCAHIDGVFSVAFRDPSMVPEVAGLWASVPFDFAVKTTGRADLRFDLARQLVLPDLGPLRSALMVRVLSLCCLTQAFGDLWRGCWDESWLNDAWTQHPAGLSDAFFSSLDPRWHRDAALRYDGHRRHALVEIDVLVSMALRLKLTELCTIYRVQFPVLRQNEDDTWYDRRGRVVFTISRGLTGVGLPRTRKKNEVGPAWNDVRTMESGTVSHTVEDDTQRGGPRERTIVYEAPFNRCDRERDYEIAWAHFEKRYGAAR